MVTRIRDGQAEIVPVALGARQPQDDRVEIAEGIQAGDTLILGSARNVAPGTPVRIVQNQ